ncbi:MAG: hypothetical protein M0Q91_14595 [Methanoregula sp.]|jgi:hypothetical protein|nr:hypothetical protein [Methanoregula sp.]
MSPDRQKALDYSGILLLFILAGSFWLIGNGQEVPEFIRMIAVTLTIPLAAKLSEEIRRSYRNPAPNTPIIQ